MKATIAESLSKSECRVPVVIGLPHELSLTSRGSRYSSRRRSPFGRNVSLPNLAWIFSCQRSVRSAGRWPEDRPVKELNRKHILPAFSKDICW